MATSKYAVEGVVWHRCPGEITYDQHKAASDTGLLDGCHLYVGLKDVTWAVGGRVHCAHCGGHAQEIRPPDVAPAGKTGSPNAAVFILERTPAAEFKAAGFDADRRQWGCCMNKSCSQHYLDANAMDSDARKTDARVGTSGYVHSATQYVMLKREELPDGGKAESRWTLESKEINKPEGKSWRRCVFCGALMATSVKDSYLTWPLRDQRIRRREVEPEDEQGWSFWGPATTFRVYRWSEWLAKHQEPVVALEK